MLKICMCSILWSSRVIAPKPPPTPPKGESIMGVRVSLDVP